MCGRFSLAASGADISEHFHLKRGCLLVPRHNISPAEPIPLIRESGKIDFLKWGFIPNWALHLEPKGFINARAETVGQKPSFKEAFKKRRCLILADGYYEWREGGARKQPYYIRQKKGALFAFAGIWEGDTCAILTTPATGPLEAIHGRMPVILEPEKYGLWLDMQASVKKEIEPLLLNPLKGEELEFFPVGLEINDPAFRDPPSIFPPI